MQNLSDLIKERRSIKKYKADVMVPEELIDKFIKTKREECRQMAAIPHPAEFDKYYNL